MGGVVGACLDAAAAVAADSDASLLISSSFLGNVTTVVSTTSPLPFVIWFPYVACKRRRHMQHWSCSISRAALVVQHWSCSIGRAAFVVQHSSCSTYLIATPFACRDTCSPSKRTLINSPAQPFHPSSSVHSLPRSLPRSRARSPSLPPSLSRAGAGVSRAGERFRVPLSSLLLLQRLPTSGCLALRRTPRCWLQCSQPRSTTQMQAHRQSRARQTLRLQQGRRSVAP